MLANFEGLYCDRYEGAENEEVKSLYDPSKTTTISAKSMYPTLGTVPGFDTISRDLPVERNNLLWYAIHGME